MGHYDKQREELAAHKLKKKRDKQMQSFMVAFYGAVSVFMFVVFVGYFL